MKYFTFFNFALLCLLLREMPVYAQTSPPNIIVILADDLGYGDLGCYGHPSVNTPHLDRMAAEGMRLTQFYVAANICTPSRAALLTGKLPVRLGMTGGSGVLFPYSAGGLSPTEITIAEVLKQKGYSTACIGKWHLGHLPEYLPTKQGFDYYFGIPYSNDMLPRPNNKFPPLPLIRNEKAVEENPDQTTLTKRYTEEAVAFIKSNKNKPFFLYYPNNFPHVPLFASPAYKGTSKRGLYGDVVAELDWSVGQIIKALKENKIDKNTIVFFTSDNGPWLTQKENGGSAGLLFEGKGSAYEGGMRVPAIAWWPGIIKPNQVSASLATSMDLFPTLAKLAHAELAADQQLDGVDMLSLLKGESKNMRELIYFYNGPNLYAIRKGPWKAHFTTKPSYSQEAAAAHDPPLLYNLDQDPSEKYDLSKANPDIIAVFKTEYEKHKATVKPVPSQLEAKLF
ncbi:MAG: sulfatase [Chitinophagaceae bacterium]